MKKRIELFAGVFAVALLLGVVLVSAQQPQPPQQPRPGGPRGRSTTELGPCSDWHSARCPTATESQRPPRPRRR